MPAGVNPILFASFRTCHSILPMPVTMLLPESLSNAGLTGRQILRMNSLTPIRIFSMGCSGGYSEYRFRLLGPQDFVGSNIPIKSSDLTGFHCQLKPFFTFLQCFFDPLALGNVGMTHDCPGAFTKQRRDRHQKPTFLAWGMAGIFEYEIRKCAIENGLDAIQRLPCLVVARLRTAAYVQVIGAYASGISVNAVFISEAFPCLVDRDDVSVSVEYRDVRCQ